MFEQYIHCHTLVGVIIYYTVFNPQLIVFSTVMLYYTFVLFFFEIVLFAKFGVNHRNLSLNESLCRNPLCKT